MSKRILIVDDEKNIRLMLDQALSVTGYEVVTAIDGEHALQKILESTPDMVLLDMKLPGIDGLEVLRRLRQSQPAVPVVMITAHGTVETAVEAKRTPPLFRPAGGGLPVLHPPYELNCEPPSAQFVRIGFVAHQDLVDGADVAVLAVLEFLRGRRRAALYLAAAVVPLILWVVNIRLHTGMWLGNTRFAADSIGQALNPLRWLVQLVKRLYSLGGMNFSAAEFMQ
jgi:CheY-like chemotaxis protein